MSRKTIPIGEIQDAIKLVQIRAKTLGYCSESDVVIKQFAKELDIPVERQFNKPKLVVACTGDHVVFYSENPPPIAPKCGGIGNVPQWEHLAEHVKDSWIRRKGFAIQYSPSPAPNWNETGLQNDTWKWCGDHWARVGTVVYYDANNVSYHNGVV